MVINLIIKNIKYLKDEKRYFVNCDTTSFLVLENTLARFNLYKNKEITQEMIEDILLEDERYKAKLLSIKFLSNMKTEKEVRNHLYKNEIESSIVEDTISYLQEEKFLDDLQYAMYFSRDKLNINKYGKNKIKISLIEKGISSDNIEKALLDLPYEVEYENLKTLAIRKIDSLKDSKNSQDKLIRHLLYKGYNYDLIKEVLKDIREEI